MLVKSIGPSLIPVSEVNSVAVPMASRLPEMDADSAYVVLVLDMMSNSLIWADSTWM
jgi:hypothetical protein